MRRLPGTPKKLATLTGPVAVGIFSDGTIMIGGPNDDPVLIANGRLMRAENYVPGLKGDISFQVGREEKR
jgi:hypothetical protein